MDKGSLTFEGLIKNLNIYESSGGIVKENNSSSKAYQALISYISSLPSKQFILLSTLIGIILIDSIEPKDQLILGKFINNIGHTILTAATQEQINIKRDR